MVFTAKPSAVAIGMTKARNPNAMPRTTDIALPPQSPRDPRLDRPVERTLGDYDKGRAKRQLNRPLGGRR